MSNIEQRHFYCITYSSYLSANFVIVIIANYVSACDCQVDNVDGHRAPVFELLSQTRSVDTQTPSHIAVGDCMADINTYGGVDTSTDASAALPIMMEEPKDERGSSCSFNGSPFSCSREDDDEEEESSRSNSPSYIPGMTLGAMCVKVYIRCMSFRSQICHVQCICIICVYV